VPGGGRRSRLDLAHDGAGIGLGRVGERDQGRPSLDDVAHGTVQLGDEPGMRGRISTTALSVSTETSGWSATT
jgi:hypothetical protein